ncbi:class I adenylate-forming enzyme family protein [Micromonospora sp. NPDC049662]|uniref:class I adenylate-forming enzyme family protein n=1 Tax=Micromonospora sp. NPDC049662 TaxID=3155397 RepID=UPI00343935B8
MDLLRYQARTHPDRFAVTEVTAAGPQSLTWAEFASNVEGTAGRAASLFSHEPRVLLAIDNTASSLTALLGIVAAGVDVAVFEASSAPLSDPSSVFHTTGAQSLLVPGGDRPDGAEGYRSLAIEEITGGPPATQGLDVPTGDDVTVLQATSGSTGEPRLARQPLVNLIRGGALYRDIYHLSTADTILAPVPMAHSFGMVAGLFASTVTGARLQTMTRFTPRGTRTAIEDGATVLLGTPLLYELVGRTVRPARSTLRVALSSGGPLDDSVALLAGTELGAPVLQVYGSTETGLIASQRPGTGPWPPGCVGTVAPGVDLRVAPPAAGNAPDAGVELAVRTMTMFRGYLDGRPDRVDQHGYYATNDVATLDEAGNLRLLRRKESFINVGGRKVNPVRLQRLIQEHPDVVDSAVYGAEAPGGEEVHAAVVLVNGGQLSTLLAHCRARLADYEVPHTVHVVAALPLTGMGKIDRNRLPGRPTTLSPSGGRS